MATSQPRFLGEKDGEIMEHPKIYHGLKLDEGKISLDLEQHHVGKLSFIQYLSWDHDHIGFGGNGMIST